MTLRELRKNKGLTQKEAAEVLQISLRTYQNYESDDTKQKSFYYEYMLDRLREYGYVDEETGLLTVKYIGDVCRKILPQYNVSYCYLFGSYAKGNATPSSDVDLFVNTESTGLKFFELIEVLREALHKKVDLIDQRQAAKNFELVNEILKEGIKVYG